MSSSYTDRCNYSDTPSVYRRTPQCGLDCMGIILFVSYSGYSIGTWNNVLLGGGRGGSFLEGFPLWEVPQYISIVGS